MAPLRRSGLAFALLASVSLAACATAPTPGNEQSYEEQVHDPIEPVNRGIFAVNRAFDTFILRPVAVVYRDVVPHPGRIAVYNFLSHLRLPLTFVNNLLQGNFTQAEATASRFIVNTTAGFGGLYDAASGLGLEEPNEDFGQTLASWGLPSGPYVMLPILGPSNVRDATGRFVDWLTDPFSALARSQDQGSLLYYRTGAEGVVARADAIETLDNLEDNSLDFYAAIRSLYNQRREADIADPGPVLPTAETETSQFEPRGPVNMTILRAEGAMTAAYQPNVVNILVAQRPEPNLVATEPAPAR